MYELIIENEDPIHGDGSAKELYRLLFNIGFDFGMEIKILTDWVN